jgi:iron complex transport system substrate-binding protein
MRRGFLLHACWLVVAVLSLSACRSQTGGRETTAPAGQGPVRVVRDMRGASVPVPLPLTRVATIDDGFVESVMTRLGTIRTLVAVGSSSQQRVWSYAYPAAQGGEYRLADGMGTMRALHPWIAELPCASRTSGDPITYETIAGAKPQVVILRVGDCTVGVSPDTLSRTIAVFESLQIPVVVLRSPTDFRGTGTETLTEEILVLGRVFGREDEAAALANELTDVERVVKSRVAGVPDRERVRALYLGLASGARASGGAAYVWGRETAESWMLEQVVGARNAYTGPGARVLLNAEQILALDPDVIFLPTANGFHPPRELSEAPYFKELQHLRAVRQHRVYALPWSPMNCARRLEYPIDLMVMATAAYPDRFRDIAVHDWVLGFYQHTYRVNDSQAQILRRGQWLE